MERDDPDFARRLAEIERTASKGGRWRGRLARGGRGLVHMWVILLAGVLVLVVLLVAVITT